MARVSYFFILIVLFFGLHQTGFAQWFEDPVSEGYIRRGIDYTYNLDFEAATKEFNSLLKTKQDHPAGYFFLTMVDWWRILLDLDDESHDAAFFQKLDHVIELTDARLKKDGNDLAGLFFKGGAMGFRGRLHANRNHWLRAANDGRRALKIVQRARQLQPDNSDILLGTGIYNYYAEAIPERYPLVKPLMWFLPKGDKAKGIEELRLASENARYAGVEASYFLMQLYFFFEKDYLKALQIARVLHSRYPNNSLFHRYVGRCLIAINRLDEGYAVFSEVFNRHNNGWRGYNRLSAREAYYYLGMYKLNTGQAQEAINQFLACDRLSKEIDKGNISGFRVMANLRMGMAYDVLNKRDEAVQAYKRVLAMDEYEDSHEMAKQYMQKPYGNP